MLELSTAIVLMAHSFKPHINFKDYSVNNSFLLLTLFFYLPHILINHLLVAYKLHLYKIEQMCYNICNKYLNKQGGKCLNEILISLIGLAGSAVGSMCGIALNSKLTQYRLKQLEIHVEKHNSLIERTYELEEKAMIHEEKLKSASRRLESLERVIQKTI